VLATVIFPPPIVFARGFLVRAGYADLTENKPALVRASIRRYPILRSHADHKQPWLFAALDPKGTCRHGISIPAHWIPHLVHPYCDRAAGFRANGRGRSFVHRSRSTSGFAIFSQSGSDRLVNKPWSSGTSGLRRYSTLPDGTDLRCEKVPAGKAKAHFMNVMRAQTEHSKHSDEYW